MRHSGQIDMVHMNTCPDKEARIYGIIIGRLVCKQSSMALALTVTDVKKYLQVQFNN